MGILYNLYAQDEDSLSISYDDIEDRIIFDDINDMMESFGEIALLNRAFSLSRDFCIE